MHRSPINVLEFHTGQLLCPVLRVRSKNLGTFICSILNIDCISSGDNMALQAHVGTISQFFHQAVSWSSGYDFPLTIVLQTSVPERFWVRFPAKLFFASVWSK